jgi:hypothetical protein
MYNRILTLIKSSKSNLNQAYSNDKVDYEKVEFLRYLLANLIDRSNNLAYCLHSAKQHAKLYNLIYNDFKLHGLRPLQESNKYKKYLKRKYRKND